MILAIDVGGSSIKFAIFDELNIIHNENIPTPQTGSIDVINAINSLIKSAVKSYNINKVGIGFPSVVSREYFVHIAPNIPNFLNIDLKKEICEKFPDLVIKIENDANAAALAELKYGEGQGLNNLIYVTLGSGIGGSIIINKTIYYGDSNGAGEIGYSNFKFDESENLIENRRGIFEEYLGRKQFTEFFNKQYALNVSSPLEIFELAENGDRNAIESFKYYGKLLGIGICSAMNLLDIHSVIIGGGLAKAEKYFYHSLIESVKLKKLNHIIPNIKIAKYIEDTGIYGAMAIID